MDRIDDVLKLLNSLILSIVDEMVKINKTSLSNIKICLQNAHENIEFLQLETVTARRTTAVESSF